MANEKLYPPSIEGKLPAFTEKEIRIPFNTNKAVNIKNNIEKMSLLVKTAYTGREIGIIKGTVEQDENTLQYYAVFNLQEENYKQFLKKLHIKQYYKVQLAYISNNGTIDNEEDDVVGYYSNIGIIKYTTIPKVSIPQLENNFNSQYEYVGKYSQQNGDETEKIYSYSFDLFDNKGNLIATSGIQIHNSEEDEMSQLSSDVWINKIDLPINEPHFLIYNTTSINGLKTSSPKYRIIKQDSVDIDLPLTLVSELDYDDGCIKLYADFIDEPMNSAVLNHNVIITRSSSLDNFSQWEEICKYHYTNDSFIKNKRLLIWEDCNIQQGIEYQYALQIYNNFGIYSNKKRCNKITADFEDIFLFDGERQLKICFNPKIASFKNTILESKIDTIGGKYPFIFRNGNVYYKEFSISGLISLIADSNKKFVNGIKGISETSLTYDDSFDFATQLTSNNIKNEREFKLKVLDWLNNGKAKIFKSPTEGNYIVRLMNVSLAPNDTLGRMLHTFTATAYEIADYNFENLQNLSLLNLPVPKPLNTIRVAQVKCVDAARMPLEEFNVKYPQLMMGRPSKKSIIFRQDVYKVNITDAIPGTKLIFSFGSNEQHTVEIGVTGSYYLQLDTPLDYIKVVNDNAFTEEEIWGPMILSFVYYEDYFIDIFNQITKITLNDEIRQFIGPDYNINLVAKYNEENKRKNSIGLFADDRRDLGMFLYIKVLKRQVQKVWRIDDKYYDHINPNKQRDIPITIQSNMIYYSETDKIYMDGRTPGISMGKPDYRFSINSEDYLTDYIDFEGRTTGSLNDATDGTSFGRVDAIRNIENVNYLHVGSGLIIDVVYRVRTKEYSIETTDANVKSIKKEWQKLIEENADKNEIEKYYKKFVNTLNAALKIEGRYWIE